MTGRNATGASTGTQRTVLIIDDDADVVKSIRACLRSTGWALTTTLEAREGIALAGTIHPDVILCDASMPELSGPRVIEMLKKNTATSQIPVILMSGFADPEMFSHLPLAAFLAKPFSPQDLRQAIESAAAESEKRHLA